MKFLECLRPPGSRSLEVSPRESRMRAYGLRKNRDDHSSLSLRLRGGWCPTTDLSSGGVPIFLHLFIQGEGDASVISRETP